MTNKQIAQAFAQGKQSGHANSMFINGNVIYSYGYHFPIALRTDKYQDDRRVVLFTMRGYSNTTAKHKNDVFFALVDANYFILPVWFVDMGVNKARNLQVYLDEARKAAKHAKRARLDLMKKHWVEQETRNLLYYNIAQALF